MTEAEKKVRAYLAEIGRRGGITSRRELTKSHARQMVAIREAKRAALTCLRFGENIYQLDAERRLTGKNSQRWRNAWSIRVTPRKRRGSAKRLSEGSTVNANMPKVRREKLPPGLLNHFFGLNNVRTNILVVLR